MVGRMKRVVSKIGLGLAGFARQPREDGSDDIRSDKRRGRSLVLFWALDFDIEDEKFLSEVAFFRTNSDVVVVTDRLLFQPLVENGCFIETLPTSLARSKLPTLDWLSYAERRFARIRHAWNPDMEFVPGTSPEVFLEVLVKEADARAQKRPAVEIDYLRDEELG